MVSAKKLIDWLPGSMLSCPGPEDDTSADGKSACLGASSIIRMSFSLMILHILMFFIVITRSKMAAMFHDGCWCAKFLIVMAMFTGSFWISNDFFKGYLEFAKVVSVIFLIYQALLMLLVSYKINDTLVGNYNKDPTSCSKWILLLVSLIFLGLTVYGVVIQFMTFGCSGNKVIMSVTTIAVVVIHALVFLKPREDASILTSSIASVYMLYLQWSALSSEIDPVCNPNQKSGGNVFW